MTSCQAMWYKMLPFQFFFLETLYFGVDLSALSQMVLWRHIWEQDLKTPWLFSFLVFVCHFLWSIMHIRSCRVFFCCLVLFAMKSIQTHLEHFKALKLVFHNTIKQELNHQWACYNSLWSKSPMPCEKHGPWASVAKRTSAFGLCFCLLSPSGHFFHMASEIKPYDICSNELVVIDICCCWIDITIRLNCQLSSL